MVLLFTLSLIEVPNMLIKTWLTFAHLWVLDTLPEQHTLPGPMGQKSKSWHTSSYVSP